MGAEGSASLLDPGGLARLPGGDNEGEDGSHADIGGRTHVRSYSRIINVFMISDVDTWPVLLLLPGGQQEEVQLHELPHVHRGRHDYQLHYYTS